MFHKGLKYKEANNNRYRREFFAYESVEVNILIVKMFYV
jgi:hypothetical protein